MELNEFSLLGSLNDAQLEKVRRRGRIAELQPHEVLHTPHDECRSVSFVLEGALAISRILPSGKEYVIRTLNEGDTFGEMVAFSPGARYPGWIIAGDSARKTRVLEIETALILEFLTERDILSRFLAELSRHTLYLLKRLEFLNLRTIRQKVAGYLLARIEDEFPQRPDSCRGSSYLDRLVRTPARLQIPRTQLAKLLGNSREAVSRELSCLEREGVIVRAGRMIEVRDPGRLEKLLLEEEC